LIISLPPTGATRARLVGPIKRDGTRRRASGSPETLPFPAGAATGRSRGARAPPGQNEKEKTV
ncbi:unnamed protein product, partial [Nesidiocoris tenuis]